MKKKRPTKKGNLSPDPPTLAELAAAVEQAALTFAAKAEAKQLADMNYDAALSDLWGAQAAYNAALLAKMPQ